MKTYEVEVYNAYRHGRNKSEYSGIATFTVDAKSKKEAREIVLNNFVGESLKKYPSFPIDPEHAPEYKREGNMWVGKLVELENHIINEYDIAMKDVIVVDVIEIK